MNRQKKQVILQRLLKTSINTKLLIILIIVDSYRVCTIRMKLYFKKQIVRFGGNIGCFYIDRRVII